MIEFSHVTKVYDNNFHALNNISFSVPSGEMAFLTGHSGAGKTTLLKLLLKIDHPTRGHVRINQKNIEKLSAKQIAFMRRDVGMIFQNPQLIDNQTIFDNVAIPLIIAGHHKQEIRSRVQAALAKVNLEKKQKLYPKALSTGEQQRVGIARAIVNKPSVLLADEPTGNLDPELSFDIMNLFKQFNAVGTTILIATHDLTLIAPMNYRIITLKKGRLLGEGIL